VNKQELRIIGMSRSGNHAVINWILSQANGRTCFINCAEPKFNPFQTARPLDDGRTVLANYPDFDLASELRGEFSAKDLLIYSHEDCFLGTMVRGAFEQEHDAMVGPSRQRADVLILRDPYNLFASRLHGGFGDVSNDIAMRIWKQHAREFTGDKRYLKQRRVLIAYNRWASDRAYRRCIAAELGIEFGDGSIAEVPAAGNGSSFDGRRYHGSATRMKTLERWKHFAGDRAFAALFDRDVHEMSRRIFGDVGYEGFAKRAIEESQDLLPRHKAAFAGS
jgi:hypothetical protein